MRVGSGTIDKIYVGGQLVSRVYLGTEIVYDRGLFAWNLSGLPGNVEVTWAGNPSDFLIIPTGTGVSVEWIE